MDHLESQKIVGSFNRREETAFDLIYDEFYPEVFDTVMKWTRGSWETVELVEGVFLKFLNTTSRFENMKHISDFLMQTAKNGSVNWLRHRQLVNAKTDEITRYYRDVIHGSTYEQEIGDQVKLGLIYRAVEMLPDHLREVFQLSHFEHLPSSVIAEKLGISKKTVANSKSLAVNEVRVILKKAGYLILISYLLS